MREILKWGDNKLPVKIGRIGENEYTQVVIDCSVVFSEFQNAIPAMTIQPPSGDAYPAIATRDGNNVVWVVNDSDLAQQGFGEMQVTFTSDNVVVKSCIWRTTISKSLSPTGEAPTPVEDWIVEANTALNAIPQTIDDALQEAKDSGEFDGFSPVITVTDIPGGHRVTITDATGNRTVDVMDGEPGDPGEPGADGVSPTVAVSPITDGHRVTITDKTGPHSFDVMDGEKGDPGDPGDPTELIDDSSTAANKTWSASKTSSEVSDLNTAINQKQDAPASGSASGKVLGLTESNNELVPAWVDQPSVPVQDVQVNGTSVLDANNVAQIPIATNSRNLGVCKVGTTSSTGIGATTGGELYSAKADSTRVKNGENQYMSIVPYNQHESTFYGLAKLAGADMASLSSVTVGQYPDAQKIAIQKMLGIYQAPWELIRNDTGTNETEANVEITVDSDGNAFELTDVFLVFWTTSDTGSAKGDYGRFRLSYGSGDTEYSDVFVGGAMSAGQTGIVEIRQENDAIFKSAVQRASTGTNSTVQKRTDYRGNAYAMSEPIDIVSGVRAYTSIKITNVTGGYGYYLYGKRKWTA